MYEGVSGNLAQGKDVKQRLTGGGVGGLGRGGNRSFQAKGIACAQTATRTEHKVVWSVQERLNSWAWLAFKTS